MIDLIELEGLGPKTEKLFNKLGINNIEDLITYYPKRYDVIARTDMNMIGNKDKVVIDGIVEGMPTVVQLSGKLKKIIFRISDNKGIYNIAVYNQVYLMRELKYGVRVIVIGKFDKIRNTIVATEVRMGSLPSKPMIEPIYGTTEGLNRKVIAKYISLALNTRCEMFDYIPDLFRERYHFMDKISAIRELHYPKRSEDFKRAKQRLKYEEFFWYLLRIRYLKFYNDNNSEMVTGKNFDKGLVDEFIKGIGFELTSDQIKTVEEIENDMSATRQMNRLVQGDVGSGKTIVAFIAAYINYLAGYQTALMVPTEILAKQHYGSALEMFKDTDVKIVILTSSITKRERNSILKEIASGEANFIIGTQSLIQDQVVYKKLGLIIADEQHRFGVNQRKSLKDKGVVPDVLAMSATPIPRTYALTIYGDMAVSSIKTKPKGRKEVSTFCKSEKEIMEVLKMMKIELDKGHQIYVIAPAIENGEDGELDNVLKLQEKMALAFGKVCKIGCVHGKLDSEEKSNIMHEFENGDIKILISTTVIEVGVNVPNASMIVIFQANLFGLSTLHQLRGRVGRGSTDSYCVLISKEKCKRLEIMEKTTDGFVISEYDFKNRGEGDLFGIRQSGMANFKVADIRRDFDLLVRVKKDVDEFFENDIELSEYKKFLDYLKNEMDFD